MDDFVQNYVGVFRKWSDFSSRARRREFWLFYLGTLIVFVVSALLSALLGRLGVLVYGLFSLAVVVPFIAVSVRRLHDTGRPGWWLLLNLVPFGAFVLLYFFIQDSEPGVNEYGPNPKESFAYA